ncbi:ImmA/IrrE family metallo-endopeptidase [Vreelandella maris]|uniref:ImmA/IrrE family metallo-endopeptidase n=1 Tax=Vreelandella maris TaxID=2729617 RepID=A0A7Y6V9L4_9GAMM|nr:ImmA/IrrE family metallo-endopeptidase [Halomonas maris]NVF15000.1 ImmA/IrrE family metallo-endopeptidase [Halomonas maris]
MNRSHATKATPKTKADIRAIAQGIRDVITGLMVSHDGEAVHCLPMMRIFEMLYIQEELAMEIVPDDELKDAVAETEPDEQLIKIRESDYNSAAAGDRDALFTLAHELGHLFMHADQPKTFARSSIKYSLESDCEWQANTFASEFLVDRRLVDTKWSIHKVQETFGVTWEIARDALEEKKREEKLAHQLQRLNLPSLS